MIRRNGTPSRSLWFGISEIVLQILVSVVAEDRDGCCREHYRLSRVVDMHVTLHDGGFAVFCLVISEILTVCF